MSATDTSSFSNIAVTAKLGSIDTVNYDNRTGAITFNGQKLDLTGIGDPKTDTMTFQKDGMFINVYAGSNNYRLNYSNGAQVKKEDGSLEAATKALDNTKSALYINGSGGSGSDVIINTKAGTVAGGGGKDKIFNFAEGATINSGDGDTFVYSVGLGAGGSLTTGAGDNNIKIISAMSGGNITTGAGDNNIALSGNMTGGTITLGAGKNQIDAAGYTLTGVNINDTASTELSSITAKSLGTSTVKLLGQETSVNVSTVDAGNNLEFGAGENSLIADTVKTGTTIKGAGSYQIKTMDGATIDASGSTDDVEIKITGSAKGAEFKLGGGNNLLYAAGKTLDSIKVTDATGASTTVVAGNIIGASSITLTGSADGNTIDVSGSIMGASGSNILIDTGVGTGIVQAGSIAHADVKMDAAGTDDQNEQVFIIKGNALNTSLTTGKANDTVSIGGSVTGGEFKVAEGDDVISIKGAVSNAKFDLGTGGNEFVAQSATGTAQTLTNVDITASGTDVADATTILAGAFKTGASGNTIELGNGANEITLNSISGAAKLNIIMGAAAGTNEQTLTVKGSVNNADVKTGAKDDTITINGAVSNSDFDLGAGGNTFEASKLVLGKTVYQTLSNVNIDASGTDAADKTIINAGAYKTGAPDNHIKLGNGANEVTLSSISSANAANALEIMLGASTGDQIQTLTVNGNVGNATITAGTGADIVNIKGAVTGNSSIDLNDGDNTLTVGKSAKGLTYVGTDADGKDDITIGGSVTSSKFNLGEGANSFTAVATIKGKEVYQTLSDVDITASGDAETDATTIKAGAFKNGKTTSNKVELGDGKNDVQFTSISGYNSTGVRHDAQMIFGSAAGDFAQKLTVTGSVNGMDYIGKSKGTDTVIINGSLANASFEVGAGDNSLEVGKTAKDITYAGTDGKDEVSFGGAVTNSDFDLGAGTNSFTAKNTKDVLQTLSNVNIDASGDTATDATTIEAGAFKNGAAASNHITLGNGNNDVTLGSIAGYKSKVAQYNVQMNLGSAGKDFDQKLTVTGAVSGLDYLGKSDGVDKITVNGAILNSTFDLGKGDNELTATKTDAAGNIRGQTLTDVSITALEGDDTLTYGQFKATKLSNDAGVPSAVIDLGEGADKINIFA